MNEMSRNQLQAELDEKIQVLRRQSQDAAEIAEAFADVGREIWAKEALTPNSGVARRMAREYCEEQAKEYKELARKLKLEADELASKGIG